MEMSCFAGLLQAVTEALPLSSSLHLKIFGIKSITQLHLITGLAGMLYILFSGLFFKFIYKVFIMLGHRESPGIYLSTISICAGLIYIKTMMPEILKISFEASLVCGIISALFMFLTEIHSDKESDKLSSNFSQVHFISSIVCNLISIVPGVSRLGSVYTGMRILGLTRHEALGISVVEGAIITSCAGIFNLSQSSLQANFQGIFQSSLFKTIGSLTKFISYPTLLCGLLYLVITILLFLAKSSQIRFIMILCCIYRICVLPFIYYSLA